MLGPVILPYVTSICNCSYNTLIFPAQWKRALIYPLLKTPTPATASETRPERDVFDQLLDFLEENSLSDPGQACYRRGNSTQTALIAVTAFIRKAVEESKLTILILFDFSKAFDSIPYRRFLQKLRSYYLSDPATASIYMYLCEKYQTVINEDGTITSWRRSASGIAQGRILDPGTIAFCTTHQRHT